MTQPGSGSRFLLSVLEFEPLRSKDDDRLPDQSHRRKDWKVWSSKDYYVHHIREPDSTPPAKAEADTGL